MDVAHAVEYGVKLEDFRHGLGDAIGDFEEREVRFGNVVATEQILANVRLPASPIVAAGLLDEYQRNHVSLARLDERQHFEPFVHGAESARKQRHGVRFLYEKQFASEEVLEMHQFRIAG